MRSLPAGTILDGRHRVDEPIGSGGFATVYAGFQLTLGVRVAIKVLHLDPQTSPAQQLELIGAFVEEARLVTRLRHDHVVRTLDQGVLQDDRHGVSVPYVVLEWCGDESLKERMKRQVGEPLPLGEAYAIVDAVTDAIAHAHELGVVHRDIKPGNVMLAHGSTGELVPRVIDFGIAKLFENDDRPGSGQTLSRYAGKFTPAYAAPEQLAGLRTGPWTDVHAIGLLFFEMVTGRAPFASGQSLGGVDPDRPTPARCGIDVGAFEPLIARAVALRPADRYCDARELRRALHEAARSMNLSVPRLPIPRASSPADLQRARLEATTADDGSTTEAPISQTARTAALARMPGAPPALGITRRPRPVMRAAVILAGVAALAGTTVWLTRAPPVVPAAYAPFDSQGSLPAVPAHTEPLVAPTPSIVASALALPAPSTYATASTSTSSSPHKPALGALKPIAPSATAIPGPDPSHAPSASGSKGIGGIVVQPPF